MITQSDKFIIGIAGGSASGKTTLVKKIINQMKNEKLSVIDLDSYYKDLGGLSEQERTEVNFDHPKSLDFDLLIKHIKDLKQGKSIEKPIYDFKTHLRKSETTLVEATKIILLEGILVFSNTELMKLLDMKIYVETASDIRLMRRIERDMKERARSLESIKKQYFETVRPMYIEFIQPTKAEADIIIPGSRNNTVSINMIISGIRNLMV